MEETTQGKLEIGQRLKQIRKSRGETQQQLGEAIGVVQQSVAAWELGTTYPALDTLVSIAKHYSVPTDYILGLMSREKDQAELDTGSSMLRDIQLASRLPEEFREGVLALIRLELAKVRN